MKDIEHRAGIEAETLGFHREFPHIGPEAVKGIEINVYAAELARVSVWIGEIQWMRRNGFDVSKNPILKPLDNIECRDALLKEDGTEAEWLEADVVIGNPPFLGHKKMLSQLGEAYVDQLRACYVTRIDSGVNLVTFWFLKAWEQTQTGSAKRVGLVATNMIRGGANLSVLEPIAKSGAIYEAWSDEPWTVEGASVRVSLICFGSDGVSKRLDGKITSHINADLSAGAVDLTKAIKQAESKGIAARGIERGGDFHIDGDTARKFLVAPINVNLRPNSDVIKKFLTVPDITARPSDLWLIDMYGLNQEQASLYEAPFAYLKKKLFVARKTNSEARTAKRWWLFRRSGQEFREKAKHLESIIVTPLVSKYRLFEIVQNKYLADTRVVSIFRSDFVCFGVLNSRFHEAWSLAKCQYHGVGNDPVYNHETTLETFPFPSGLEPNRNPPDYDNPHMQAVANAAKRLNELRENWLNPPDRVKRVPEVVPGYPDRILPISDAAAAVLKKRTLTNLYNERPTWLQMAHAELDAAVAAAYGWPQNITDHEVLEKLLALNHERAGIALMPQEESEEEPKGAT